VSERLEYLARGEAGADAALTVARAALADRQGALLAALVAGAAPPPGFDPAQVRAQALGLAAKRRDTVARVEPEPARLLGAAFGPLFLRYARHRPQPGGYRDDARAFAAWALVEGGDELDAGRRRALERWLAPPRPPVRGPLGRLRRALRRQHD
jgi:hypothetical protein